MQNVIGLPVHSVFESHLSAGRKRVHITNQAIFVSGEMSLFLYASTNFYRW